MSMPIPNLRLRTVLNPLRISHIRLHPPPHQMILWLKRRRTGLWQIGTSSPIPKLGEHLYSSMVIGCSDLCSRQGIHEAWKHRK